MNRHFNIPNLFVIQQFTKKQVFNFKHINIPI